MSLTLFIIFRYFPFFLYVQSQIFLYIFKVVSIVSSSGFLKPFESCLDIGCFFHSFTVQPLYLTILGAIFLSHLTLTR